MQIIQNLKVINNGSVEYQYTDTDSINNGATGKAPARPWNARGNLTLIIIRMAWDAGFSMEDLADGFGAGLGTMGGDWSGIRDSSEAATAKMLERALNSLSVLADRNARKLAGMAS